MEINNIMDYTFRKLNFPTAVDVKNSHDHNNNKVIYKFSLTCLNESIDIGDNKSTLIQLSMMSSQTILRF